MVYVWPADCYRNVDGSYFFGRGLGDREKASFFPATIAYQLSRSKRSCRNIIKKTIETSPDILSDAFPSQFRQLLLRTAKKRWSLRGPITIVIDALDECDDVGDQVTLLKLILETVSSSNTRFLIASRPEQHIHAFFQQKDVSQHTYHIRLDEESFNTSRDIEVFLRDEFRRIRLSKPELCPALPNGEDWPGHVIIVQIRDDSDSQFIFPTLAIAFIDTPFYPPHQQLQTLLSAPPIYAFSKLDALYERILVRCPPELHEGSDALLAYRKTVKGILTTIITWSEPRSAPKIADVLGEKVDVVQNIILGPMRSLFKFDPNKPDSPITLCHKSLRDYLLDLQRSHGFFISSKDSDDLFIDILSRPSPAKRPYLRDDLLDVLTAVMVQDKPTTANDIRSSLLGIQFGVISSVVDGPAKALFDTDSEGNIQLSTASLKPFLHDANRSGAFFIQSGTHPDTIFIRILSRKPPSNPLKTYSREVLMGVLTIVVALENWVKVPQIASALDVAPEVVSSVVFGPTGLLFKTGDYQDVNLCTPSFKAFLLDANRAGTFFVSERRQDAFFTRILFHQQPSDKYSEEVLKGVLMVLMIWPASLTVTQIAMALDVRSDDVEAAVFKQGQLLFYVWDKDSILLPPPLQAFLQDANRAGKFYIPPKSLNPNYDLLYTKIEKIRRGY